MLLQEERNLIVQYGKKLITHGLAKSTGGNLSICNRQQQLVALSPSGLDYFETEPEDIPVLTMEHDVVEGRGCPSSECEMHMIFYKKRDDIDALVHTHSVFATAFASTNSTIPPIHYLMGFAGKDIRCAPYATVATRSLAEGAFNAMIDRKAVLLANHGLLAGGKSIGEAFTVAEIAEYCAEIYYRAKCIGEPAQLEEQEMDVLINHFTTYGK